MIDALAFLILLVAIAAVPWALWRAFGAPARPAVRAAACLAITLPVAGVVSWRFSNARTVQLFGEIVPRVETADSVVALTFDDGPLPDATARILEVLDAHGARATFFLNGAQVDAHPEAARRIVAAGHEVGNHSYTHPMMLGLSLTRIRDEIEHTDAALRRAGHAGPIHFRSPYGKKYAALPYHLATTGRTNVFWDVEPETFPEIARDAERIAAHVLAEVRPGSIVLLHMMGASRAESLRAVPAIVEGLHARGYRLVTVSDLMARTRG